MSLDIYRDVVTDNYKIKFPSADPIVLEYIANYISKKRYEEFIGALSNKEIVPSYEFANNLYKMFERGTLCWACPTKRIVWVDEDSTPYDINGISMSDYTYLIPIEFIQDYLIKRNGTIEVGDISNYDEIINKYLESTMR